MKPNRRRAIGLLAGLIVLTLSLGCASLTTGSRHPLINAAALGDTAAVNALLAQGADVNAQPADGVTALMWAALQGHTATVEALLAQGAAVNAQGKRGWTAVMGAARFGYTATIEAMLKQGADLRIKTHEGGTALDIAKNHGYTHLVQVLEEAQEMAVVQRLKRSAPEALSPSPEVAKAETEKRMAEAERARAEARKAQAEAERAELETEKLKTSAEREKGEQAKATAADVVDVEQLPKMPAKVKQDAYAVVIGIEKYTDLMPPAFAVRDATWVKEYLIHVLGYPEENIQLLTNEQATYSRVRSVFETWLPNQDPKGSVFVYYSGHGAPDPATGESYLVPLDGSPQDLKATGYPLKRLAEVLGTLPAKEIIVAVDSCFSGQPGTRSVLAKGAKPMVITTEGPWAALGERGIVFTAGNQVSTVYEEKKHGLFTYFFLKGLQGAADLNGAGAVQAQELFTYLKPEVVKTARRQNVQQEPGLWPQPDRLGPRASRALAVIGR